MFSVMTYSVLAVSVMSFPSMVNLMSLVIDVMPMGITLSMVGGCTMLPMAIGVDVSLLVGIFSLWHLDILLAQVAVHNKMAFSSTFETSLLSDYIYVTI